ncbi:hypothetical protein NBRC116588_20930 [Pyruvatibacter sp. HU-CL02332]
MIRERLVDGIELGVRQACRDVHTVNFRADALKGAHIYRAHCLSIPAFARMGAPPGLMPGNFDDVH